MTRPSCLSSRATPARRRPRILLGAAAAALAGALAAAVPAQAAWMVPGWPYRAKDFTIVKRDGWYHVFYIRNHMQLPYDSTEVDFGHARSRDFYNWTHLAPVLPVRPGAWDNRRVWAPSIVEVDGVYYMFYTGVTDGVGGYVLHQRTGLAVSTDLLAWNRLDEPVFECAGVPWTVCDPSRALGGEFRDPFVMRDPRPGGGWLMYYNAMPAADPDAYVAGIAASDGDFTRWTDLGPLWATHRAHSGTPLVESVHLFRRGELWYLLFTGNGTQPLRLATGPDPVGAPASWTQRGSLSDIVGLSTTFWFASEHIADGTRDFLAFVNFDRVDVREIRWGADWRFTLVQPDPFRVQRLGWSRGEVFEGQCVELIVDAVNWLGREARLEFFERLEDGSELEVPAELVGMRQVVEMTSGTTQVHWCARLWPSDRRAGLAELVVRLDDRTAASPPLYVLGLGPLSSPGGLFEQSGTGWRPRPTMHPFAAADGPGPRLRMLARHPLGTPAALLVELEGPAAAQLEIFDLGGRRVRVLADRTLPAGATVVPWDGRTAAGTSAAPGVYFARLRTASGATTARLLLPRR